MFKLRITPGGITRIILSLAAIGFNESRNGPKVSLRDLASEENRFYLGADEPTMANGNSVHLCWVMWAGLYGEMESV